MRDTIGRETAERILARYPLSPEEEQWYRFEDRKPQEYRAPKPNGDRECGHCGKGFSDTYRKGEVEVSALEKFVEHQLEHNPSSAQWAEAHLRIQKAK